MRARTVSFPKTKNGDSRSVPMTDTLRELLQRPPRPVNPEARVLPDWQPAALTVALGRLVHTLKLSSLTFHDLRHDTASTLISTSRRSTSETRGAPPTSALQPRRRKPSAKREVVPVSGAQVALFRHCPSALCMRVEAYPRPEMVAPTGRAASSIALRGLLRVA